MRSGAPGRWLALCVLPCILHTPDPKHGWSQVVTSRGCKPHVALALILSMSCVNLDVCKVCVEYGIVLEGCVCCGIIYMSVSCTERHACVTGLYASYLLSFTALQNEMLVCENVSSSGWCFCSSFFVSHLIIIGNVIMAYPEMKLQWGFCLIFLKCKSTGLVVLFFIWFFVFLFFSYRVNQIKNKTEKQQQTMMFIFFHIYRVCCTHFCSSPLNVSIHVVHTSVFNQDKALVAMWDLSKPETRR